MFNTKRWKILKEKEYKDNNNNKKMEYDFSIFFIFLHSIPIKSASTERIFQKLVSYDPSVAVESHGPGYEAGMD